MMLHSSILLKFLKLHLIMVVEKGKQLGPKTGEARRVR